MENGNAVLKREVNGQPTRDSTRSLGDAPTLLANSGFSSLVCLLTHDSQSRRRFFGATGTGDCGVET